MRDQGHIPPKWPDRFLNYMLAPRFIDEIQGDLHEAFRRRVIKNGMTRARLMYTIDVVRSLSLETIDPSFYSSQNSSLMLGNYLKSGWRNFSKYRAYSTINLFGLSLGFSAALLLFLIVRYENSFDAFHTHLPDIYRVGNRFVKGGFDDRVVTPQTPLMDEEYADIVSATRYFPQGDIMNVAEKHVRTGYTMVDPGFADMFDFQMKTGDLKKALSTAGQIVLTEKSAARLFGDDDPMGKTVRFVTEDREFVVGGIVTDPPSNSTLQFESLISWSNAPKWLDEDQVGNWYNTFIEAYVMLEPRVSKDELEEKLVAFVNAHFLQERRADWRVLLLPMSSEHFRLTDNEQMIAIFAIMAGAILLISCINFANLSIAQTLRRTREIGLRRVLGSLRRQIALQFVSESAISFALSLVAGIAITGLAIPFVNDLYGFNVAINLKNADSVLIFIGVAGLIAVVTSALATAMAITNVKPVNALKGLFGRASRGEMMRRSLLVVQFAASIILLIGTIVIWQQTHYMKSQNLRFNTNNVVVVDMWTELFRSPEKVRQQLSTFAEDLRQESSVKSVSFGSSAPGEYDENYNGFQVIDSATSEKTVSLRKVYVGAKYFETLGMSLVVGRDFSTDIASDTAAVIINETAMRELGWKDIDNKLLQEGGGTDKVRVIGVVKDYFYQSLKRPVQPLIHIYSPKSRGRLLVQFADGRIKDGLSSLENKWSQLDAYEPFSYRFVDKTFEKLYDEQERLGTTAGVFSSIAISIACMGLFSITAYSIRLRRKEVGIRKVLGASVSSLVVNLSIRYTLLIVVGFVIACPLVYAMTSGFLNEFAYRISLSPVIFVAGGLSMLLLAMGIIFVITRKAAIENPIQALKEEG